jgi:hypothetical protein
VVPSETMHAEVHGISDEACGGDEYVGDYYAVSTVMCA